MRIEENDTENDKILKIMFLTQQRYFVVKTKFTDHHIERTNYTDRGRWKWIAETNMAAWDAMDKNDEEARRSHIDGGDLFPRLYFNDDCFLKEFNTWLAVRGLDITDIVVPEI